MSDQFKFSERTNWPFASNEIIATLDKLRAGKTPILDLTESNPTHCGFNYPSERILKALNDPKNLSYAPLPEGMVNAREAIHQYYLRKDIDVPVGRIILTSSTSEAYSFLFKLLTNPGDDVLFPRPSYPLFESLVELHDIDFNSYPLEFLGDWKINMEALEHNIHPMSKAVVLVNPNNPTGSYIKRDQLKGINRICKENGMAVISDEVFLDFSLGEKNEDAVSLINNKEVLTFVLGGISKTLALPQMKLSWIILSGPDDLVSAAIKRLEIISDTYLSVSTPIQNALSAWLEEAEHIQKQVIARLKENLLLVKKMVKDFVSCDVLDTEGGWYAVIRIPEGISEEELVLNALTKDHVFIHPGYFFDFHEEGFLVLSLLTPTTILEEGLEKVLKRVK